MRKQIEGCVVGNKSCVDCRACCEESARTRTNNRPSRPNRQTGRRCTLRMHAGSRTALRVSYSLSILTFPIGRLGRLKAGFYCVTDLCVSLGGRLIRGRGRLSQVPRHRNPRRRTRDARRGTPSRSLRTASGRPPRSVILDRRPDAFPARVPRAHPLGTGLRTRRGAAP